MSLRLNTILVVLILANWGCGKEKNTIPITNTVDSISDLTTMAISGDTSAYDQLELDYLDSPYHGFLYPSMIMANKYGYTPAFINVYFCLTDFLHKKDFTELDDLDDRTRSLALEYLANGAEKGDSECMRILGHYYIEGKHLPMNKEKGEELIRSVESNN